MTEVTERNTAIAPNANRSGNQTSSSSHFKHILAILDAFRRQTQITHTFDGRRNVIDRRTPAVAVIAGNTDIAYTVDVGVTIGERPNAQIHVTAAEDQPVLVEQRITVDPQIGGAAQRPVVDQRRSIDGQAVGRGEPAQIGQGATAGDRGGRCTGDARHAAQIDARSQQPQIADTAHPPIAAVSPAQLNIKPAITGNQPLVRPVPATSHQLIRGQQLPTGRLHKIADIHRQPPGLNHAAVGPAVRVQGQAATGHQ